MRLRFSEDRVLAVVAHPDDAELLCAGTLARAADEGASVGVVILCRGDRGQTNPPLEDLAAIRKREATKAAELVGAELLFGEIPDGTLADVPEQRQMVVELLRRFRPTLVIAHAPNDYHADHRAASRLAETASWFAASHGHQTEAGVLERVPGLWFMDTVGMSGFDAGFYVDITSYVEVKRRMLRFHESQLARGADQSFSALEAMMLQQCSVRGEQAGVSAAEAFRWAGTWKRTLAF